MSNVLVPRRELRPGMVVECPRRSSLGPHVATVTHVDAVGTGRPRSVVSLDCGHGINMTDEHGLYVAEERPEQ